MNDRELVIAYGDIDLALEDIFGLLIVVLAVSCRSRDNSVEAGCQVRCRV